MIPGVPLRPTTAPPAAILQQQRMTEGIVEIKVLHF
jgi:hypothetical protein